MKIEDVEIVLKQKTIITNYYPPHSSKGEPTETIFKAIQENDRIIIKDEDSVYCDYLKNEEEMEIFFNNIRIDTYIMDNATFGTHYNYGENPKNEFISVSFCIDEIIEGFPVTIDFFDGYWSSCSFYNEDLYSGWDLDESTSSRDKIIESIKLYIKNKIRNEYNEHDCKEKKLKMILEEQLEEERREKRREDIQKVIEKTERLLNHDSDAKMLFRTYIDMNSINSEKGKSLIRYIALMFTKEELEIVNSSEILPINTSNRAYYKVIERAMSMRPSDYKIEIVSNI